MNSNVKTAIFWVVLICVAVLLWTVVRQGNARSAQDLTYTAFWNEVNEGRVKAVTITGTEVKGEFREGKTELTTTIPTNDPDLLRTLRDKGVNVTIKEVNSNGWVSILINVVPFVLLIAFWLFMMRQMQSGGNKALSFGKSRARLHSSQQRKVTFKDVAGAEEAKEELQEIIEFLREPQKFQKLGGRIPKGVLLIGPPGTGKTLLARAIAGEANVPFFSISGSDFVEMFVGVGASRVRDLFEQGKKNAPCIIFIDEIDAVGRHRGAGLGGGHDEREQTLNQLLVEMDGFESNEGVILVAATNRPDVLDPALLRPGRFDRRVVVGRPDVKGREAILRVHSKKTPLADDVELSVIARGTPGFAGADLANLVNEAALAAARQNRKVVTMYDFEIAKDKVMMGAERKSMVITEEEKKNTAYHEAGHALVAAIIPEADPLHKVSIIPRGMALGITMQLPIDDKHSYSATLPGRAVVHPDGRPHRRREVHEAPHHRRRQRHRARHRPGPQDGLRVGYERPGSDELRQEGRADLPGARNRPAPRLQRRHRHQDRRRGAPHGGGSLRAIQEDHRRKLRRPGVDCRSPARTRGAGRGRGEAADRGPHAADLPGSLRPDGQGRGKAAGEDRRSSEAHSADTGGRGEPATGVIPALSNLHFRR